MAETKLSYDQNNKNKSCLLTFGYCRLLPEIYIQKHIWLLFKKKNKTFGKGLLHNEYIYTSL